MSQPRTTSGLLERNTLTAPSAKTAAARSPPPVTVCERSPQPLAMAQQQERTSTKQLPRAKLRYRGNQPLTAHELALYALLHVSFGGKSEAYKSHGTDNQSHHRVSSTMNHLFPAEGVVTPCAINSYFMHSRSKSRGNQLGKILNNYRWNYFIPDIETITTNCKSELQALLDQQQPREELVADVLSCLETAVVTANKKIIHISTKQKETSPDVRSMWTSLRTKFPDWRIAPPGDCSAAQFCQYPPGSGVHAVRYVSVADNQTWTAGVANRRCDLSWADLPPTITNAEHLKAIISCVEQAQVCEGCSLDKYDALVSKQGTKFYGRDKEVVAEVDPPSVPNRAIRSAHCVGLMPTTATVANSRSVCATCSLTDNTLRKAKSRLESRSDNQASSKFTPYTSMTRDELLSVARSSATQLRKTWVTIARLREAEKSKEELHTDDNDNMTKMFKTLQNGLTSIDERRNNPKCKWSDCVEKFATISELHEHCVTVHAHNSGGDAPIQRQYKCQWSGCSREAFNNHAHLARHLHDHTGREEDSFLQVLIEDQAKSLTCSKSNMRWHPAVIRWCLQQHARSSAGYEEMRQAGFLRLPTSRTLQSYATFSEPKSGWAKETLDEMRLQFTQQQSTSPARAANVGALCFDEVKIKEGLLFDPSSNKLVGFIDNYHGDEEEPKDILATHITQFYFKSLFSGFAFPCAYFLTRNVTADQMSEMFWTGVRALHDHGFQVLLACRDGASYNRTFFHMNAADVNWKADNPWSQEPIFFFSDPPHLFKKLRNQLFNSGSEGRHTRKMEIAGQEVVWTHIENALNRDQQAPLRVTPLTREHVNLDSLTKMKNKLAYDVFHESVERHMATHDNDTTRGTQEYLRHGRLLFDVYMSSEPMSSPADQRLTNLNIAKDWFQTWREHLRHAYPDKKTRATRFVAWQTFEDICLSVDGLQGLITYMASRQFTAKHGVGHFVTPKRVNQDIIESHFGQQRGACGGSTNMTAYAYAYNNQRIIRTKVATKNRRRNGEDEPLRKRKKTKKTLPLWKVEL